MESINKLFEIRNTLKYNAEIHEDGYDSEYWNSYVEVIDEYINTVDSNPLAESDLNRKITELFLSNF